MTSKSEAAGLIHPVILCGGSGTRLWPVSRQSFPKQFSRLVGEESLFQATARRPGATNDITSPPTTTPRIAMIIGSIRLLKESTALSTSSS